MQTLKQVLGREEERRNLRIMGLCYAVVIALMFCVFFALHMKSHFQDGLGNDRGEQGATVPQTDRVSR